ncbi:hypothetical protein [Chryseobacterium sp.]|uniref:DUF7716 domain-containing protein n=1 Tax=Chryseobacterium sp. TaxID=1871047 RepID=UPI00388E2B9E
MTLKTIPKGGFYLTNSSKDWNLETIGIFVDDEFGEEEEKTEQLLANGWVETLDSVMIEDVIYHAKEQKEKVTTEELLEAFIYFIDNDSYLILKK